MDIQVERIIERPASQVASFFFDAGNNPMWQEGMRSCDWTTDPPIGLGSRYDQVAEFRGKPVLATFQVTEYEPERKIRIESADGTFPIQVTRRVEPLDDARCRVSAAISGQPSGVMRILIAIGRRRVQKSIEADYDRLVEHFQS